MIFIESYGAVSFDRPEFARPLAASRVELERAVRETNREMVSAFVESPTFGGSSWFAHISLLSGVEVRDHDTNLALMSEKRDTLATVFARHGYRTIALMPGLKLPWPEGSFYGFNQTYNAERLAYPGPDFGWFAVPDQFSLAWLDQAEVGQPSRLPLFVFFPTLSTHFPFSPTPPYQPDWPRLLTESKYGGQAIVDAYSDQLDWVDFGPAYVKSMAYAYATIAGIPAPSRRPRLRRDPGGRPSTARGGHRRGRVVGRAGARHRQPAGCAGAIERARVHHGADARAPSPGAHARTSADTPRRLRRPRVTGQAEPRTSSPLTRPITQTF